MKKRTFPITLSAIYLLVVFCSSACKSPAPLQNTCYASMRDNNSDSTIMTKSPTIICFCQDSLITIRYCADCKQPYRDSCTFTGVWHLKNNQRETYDSAFDFNNGFFHNLFKKKYRSWLFTVKYQYPKRTDSLYELPDQTDNCRDYNRHHSSFVIYNKNRDAIYFGENSRFLSWRKIKIPPAQIRPYLVDSSVYKGKYYKLFIDTTQNNQH